MQVKIERKTSEIESLNGWCVYELYKGAYILIDTAFASEYEARQRAAEYIKTGY